jgi:stress response protein YsnF
MDEPQRVYTSDGHQGVIVGETSSSRDDARFLEVEMEDGTRLHVPAELLELRADGTFHLPVGYADIRGQRAIGESSGARHFVVPVVVEELEVGHRAVTSAIVHIHKRVREREEVVDASVTREEVHVERVPMDQLVETPPVIRSEGETLVIPVLEEVLVVERRLRLKEEVRLTWSRAVESAPQRVTLRAEEVIVERRPPEEGAGEVRGEAS